MAQHKRRARLKIRTIHGTRNAIRFSIPPGSGCPFSSHRPLSFLIRVKSFTSMTAPAKEKTTRHHVELSENARYDAPAKSTTAVTIGWTVSRGKKGFASSCKNPVRKMLTPRAVPFPLDRAGRISCAETLPLHPFQPRGWEVQPCGRSIQIIREAQRQ